ncbi:MAG: CPBP family intramembrane metalloprotease [Phycisphaeraceae bacterium]|nr:CPBP family intramembrane metalloprotease [Phycisphaeraceae bacterium]
MARRSTTAPHRRKNREDAELAGYARASKAPWQILCLLLPLIVVYEVGSLIYLTSPETDQVATVEADRLLGAAFERFGVTGLHLPGVVVVVVLLVWHLLTRDSWRIRWTVLLGMVAESALWTFPLLVIAVLLDPTALAQGTDVRSWDLGARITISIGAGLYEELLFRMIIIAAAHFALVDLLRVPERAGAIAAVAISAVLFGWYHLPAGMGFDLGWFLFYCAAGAYFGVVYLLRDFGIVVATHAIYDLIVLVLLAGGS